MTMHVKWFTAMAVFICTLGVTAQVNAQAQADDLREPFYNVCKAKQGSESYCRCLTGQPYDDFVYSLQYGSRDLLIKQQQETKAMILQEPTMSAARIAQICAKADPLVYGAEDGSRPADWNAQLKALQLGLKQQYTTTFDPHVAIRKMTGASGYCAYSRKIAAASKQAEQYTGMDVRSDVTHHLPYREYGVFIRAQGNACKP